MPNCLKTPIPKFNFYNVAFNLAQNPRKSCRLPYKNQQSNKIETFLKSLRQGGNLIGSCVSNFENHKNVLNNSTLLSSLFFAQLFSQQVAKMKARKFINNELCVRKRSTFSSYSTVLVTVRCGHTAE